MTPGSGMPRTIDGVEVLPPEREQARRLFAIWLARHPSETAALEAAGLVPVASALWADCWSDAGRDATRRVRQLRLSLACAFRRLRAIAERLEETPTPTVNPWDAVRLNQRLGLYATEIVARLQEIGDRLDEARAREDLDAELERASAYWRSAR